MSCLVWTSYSATGPLRPAAASTAPSRLKAIRAMGPMPGASGSPIGRREWASRRITVPSGLELASSAPPSCRRRFRPLPRARPKGRPVACRRLGRTGQRFRRRCRQPVSGRRATRRSPPGTRGRDQQAVGCLAASLGKVPDRQAPSPLSATRSLPLGLNARAAITVESVAGGRSGVRCRRRSTGAFSGLLGHRRRPAPSVPLGRRPAGSPSCWLLGGPALGWHQ